MLENHHKDNLKNQFITKQSIKIYQHTKYDVTAIASLTLTVV